MSFSPYRAGRKPRPEPEPYESRIPADANEVTLSKSDAAAMPKEHMKAFLAELAAWAEARAMDGYTIHADPDEGPGTMRWRAERPGASDLTVPEPRD